MGIRSDYLALFAPLHRSKVELALDRQMRLNGEYMFRWQAAERLSKGAFRLDSDKGRF